jgi:MFS family permease
MKANLARAFSSLAVRNYRLYFAGQIVSASGNWMQQIAIAWLVLKLTDSTLQLGLTTAAQQGPYLLLGAWGGLVADRLPTRRLLMFTQSAQMVAPAALGVIYELGTTKMWMVYAVVLTRGLLNTVDNPARQSFVAELVGRDRLVNAVSLNASVIQAARLVGPAAAAIVIATLGIGPCFLINSLSFTFMLAALWLIQPRELQPAAVAQRGKGQLRAGLSHAVHTPALRVPLLLMAVVGLLSFNFTVVLPAVARFTFNGTATTYALMMNFLAAGALAGAVAAGTRVTITPRNVSWASVGFGIALGLAAATSDLRITLAALIAVGAASVTFSASVQGVIQLAVEPEMRGRILSLYQILYQGTTPLGAILIGWLASVSGARSGLVLGAVAAVLAGLIGVWTSPSARTLSNAAIASSSSGIESDILGASADAST